MLFIFHAKLKRGVQTYFRISESTWMKVVVKQVLLYLPWQIHMVRTRQLSRESCECFSCFDLTQSALTNVDLFE